MTIEEQMRLSAEWDARVQPTQGALPQGDLGALARGLAYFGRAPSEHDHRLALERENRRRA